MQAQVQRASAQKAKQTKKSVITIETGEVSLCECVSF